MKINFIDRLREKSLSLTAVRLAVLDALHERPHSDAAQLLTLVQKKIPTTSIQAVYQNLKALTEQGIIREIKPKGQVSLYETRTDDNHHHLVCRHCARVMDAECQSSALCLMPMNDQGFILDEAEIIFWGICPDCQKSSTKKRRK